MNAAEAFERIAGTRRSVYPKDYLPGRVDDAIVMKMLELADRAPTHKRTEPWRFTVFTGEGLKKLAKVPVPSANVPLPFPARVVTTPSGFNRRIR